MWDPQFERLLRRHLPFLDADQRLGAGLSLCDLGLDSMGTVELLDSLETAYGVRFVDDALRPESFDTPGVLWRTLSAMREPAE